MRPIIITINPIAYVSVNKMMRYMDTKAKAKSKTKTKEAKFNAE